LVLLFCLPLSLFQIFKILDPTLIRFENKKNGLEKGKKNKIKKKTHLTPLFLFFQVPGSRRRSACLLPPATPLPPLIPTKAAPARP
jgi:hypothetical protein